MSDKLEHFLHSVLCILPPKLIDQVMLNVIFDKPNCHFFICFYLFLGGFLAAQNLTAATTEALKNDLKKEIEAAKKGMLLIDDAKAHRVEALQQFYEKRSYEPVWFNEKQAIEKANLFLPCIASSYDNGLSPNDYHYEVLSKYLTNKEDLKNSEWQAIELLLSDAYLLMAKHYLQGKVDAQALGLKWYHKKRKFDLIFYFEEALRENDLCESLNRLLPIHEEYEVLKKVLRYYRSIDHWGYIGVAWRSDSTFLLERSAIHPVVIDVRQCLQQNGDLAEAPLTMLFDDKVEVALKQFQARHNIFPSGKITAKTLHALNQSRNNRIAQIKANMERWRWVNDDFGPNYIAINIPDFTLKYYENYTQTYAEKVVVGRKESPTPAFRDDMTYLVLNPYWNIPRSIVLNELAPEVRSDTSYLVYNGIEVLQGDTPVNQAAIDWQTADYGAYLFRQKASEYNPMGVIKFMFPNNHQVYMHDTPLRYLFNNATRSYSHGCIRLNEPLSFSYHILRNNPDWAPEHIDTALQVQNETIVSLKQSIPINTFYWTVFVEEERGVNFREDLYDWDLQVNKALEQKITTTSLEN